MNQPLSTWWFCPLVPADKWKARDVQVFLPDGRELVAHWASDLSGDEQPPFQGWFTASGRGFIQISQPMFWRQCDKS